MMCDFDVAVRCENANAVIPRYRALQAAYRSFSIGSPGARSSWMCGFASPVVPGGVSLLTLWLLTRSSVVTEATAITTPRATAKSTNAVL